VGGPIVKSKAFFFGSYDGYRFNSGSVPTLQSIPTTAARTGNFSGFPAVIYDPNTTACTTSGVCSRTPFADNIIPAKPYFAGSEIAAILSSRSHQREHPEYYT